MRTGLIAFTGRARAGKDTATDFLMRKHTNAFKYSFADPVRAMLNTAGLLQGVEEVGKEAPLPKHGASYRQLMQTLGTDWGREMIHKDIWVIVAENYLSWIMKNHGLVIISDVRYDNEASMVWRMGGTIVRLVRDQAVEVREHSSEHGISDIFVDYTIHNNSTIEKLEENLAGFFPDS